MRGATHRPPLRDLGPSSRGSVCIGGVLSDGGRAALWPRCWGSGPTQHRPSLGDLGPACRGSVCIGEALYVVVLVPGPGAKSRAASASRTYRGRPPGIRVDPSAQGTCMILGWPHNPPCCHTRQGTKTVTEAWRNMKLQGPREQGGTVLVHSGGVK